MWKVTIPINGTLASSLIRGLLQKQSKAITTGAPGYLKKTVSNSLTILQAITIHLSSFGSAVVSGKTVLLVQLHI